MCSNNSVRYGCAGLLVLVVSGCALNETDPRRASTLQMLINPKPIENRLVERRGELDSIHSKIGTLDERVAAGMRELQAAEKSRDAAGEEEARSADAVQKAERKIAERKADGERLRVRIVEARREVERLQGVLASSETERQDRERRLGALKNEISQLQRQVDFFEELNAETVRESARSSLRERR